MISRTLPKFLFAVFVMAAAGLFYAFSPLASAQTSGTPDAQATQLDYEFFKTRVEPIFL